jgi:FixJ family two-component response regulator
VSNGTVICIVDDDDEVRSSIANYFRAAGLEVRTFASADDFLRSPERPITDCLVTDIHMNGADGMALQRELKRAGSSFPVIVMTGFPTEPARAEAARLGATAFLVKPIDPDELLEQVRSAIA